MPPLHPLGLLLEISFWLLARERGLIPLLSPATCGLLGDDIDGLLAVVKLQSPSSSLCSWLEARESDRDELEREWGDESVRE